MTVPIKIRETNTFCVHKDRISLKYNQVQLYFTSCIYTYVARGSFLCFTHVITARESALYNYLFRKANEINTM